MTPIQEKDVSTPVARKRKPSDNEPELVKTFRGEAAVRHTEKMDLLKELINVLKDMDGFC